MKEQRQAKRAIKTLVVEIPTELHTKVKIKVAREETRLRTVVIRLLESYVKAA